MAALQAASHLSWTSKARFLVLIADAPAHGRDCNDLATDSFPAGSPRPGCGVRDVMLALRKQQVDLMLMPGERELLGASKLHVGHKPPRSQPTFCLVEVLNAEDLCVGVTYSN